MNELVDVIDIMDEDNRKRDAYSSINGYFYQFELTLLHLIQDGSEQDAFQDNFHPANYKVETIEDYVKYFEVDNKRFIRVAQIKHYTTEATNSKYYDAVLWLYYNFLKFLEKNLENTEYKAVIFHFDKSGKKDNILEILEEALKSNENKTDKNKSSSYLKIKDQKNNSEENKFLFSQNAFFQKTESIDEITDTLKKKLMERYNSTYGEEILYAATLSKLIQDGKEKKTLTLPMLDDYIKCEIPEVIPGFYKEKIIDKIFYLIDSKIENLPIKKPFVKSLSNQVIIIYENIFNKIKKYIKVKFQEDPLRGSFLRSIVPKKLNKQYNYDSVQEYENFLECLDIVDQFISKLAKIMFFYQSETKKEAKLEDWFQVDNVIWLFKYPEDERGNGVIIGNIPCNPYEALVEIIARFGNMDKKPDVMYFDYIEEIKASKRIPYKFEYTNVQDSDDFIFCEPSQEHFHIQCLRCLDLYKYENLNKVSNIFSIGCVERGDSN